MRIAAMVLGIIGGLISAGGVFEDIIRGFPAEYIAWEGLLFPIMAIAGGVLALVKPAVGGILMLVSAIGGFVAAYLHWPIFGWGGFYIFASFLLIAGSALSFAAYKKLPAVRVVAMVLGIFSGLFLSLLFHAMIHLGHGNGDLVPGVVLSLMAIASMAIAGGALALVRPAVGGTLMLVGGIVSGIGSYIIVANFMAHLWPLLLSCTIAGLLLIIGATLSFAAAKERPPVRKAAMVLGISAGLIAVFGVLGAFVPAWMPYHHMTPREFLASLAAGYGVIYFLFMAIAGMAIAGGALALVRPAVGGTLMLVSGIEAVRKL
jgi:hypothetical protein